MSLPIIDGNQVIELILTAIVLYGTIELIDRIQRLYVVFIDKLIELIEKLKKLKNSQKIILEITHLLLVLAIILITLIVVVVLACIALKQTLSGTAIDRNSFVVPIIIFLAYLISLFVFYKIISKMSDKRGPNRKKRIKKKSE